MSTFKKSALFSAALLVLAGSVHAQKAGDNILGVGIALIQPSASVGPLTSVGPAAGGFNAATAGTSVSIDSVTTATIGFLHMFTDNIAAELTLGVPPKLTVDLKTPNGGATSHPGAATATELTPAVVAKYLFNTPNDAWRPYLGLGVTYASFSDVSPNRADPLVNNLAGGGASLSSSWAPVYNLGVIYNIDQRWSINASVSYIPLKTTASFTGGPGTGGTTTTGDLTLNPTQYVIRVGYKF